MAQSESKAISDNMRWSYQRRMENGSYVPACQPFGYVLEENKIQIHSEHAEVIQEIFRQYLSGIGAGTIANNLNSAQIGNRFGVPLWTPRAIRYIIKNEKYTGNSRWHKYYTTDTLPFRNVINRGEKNPITRQVRTKRSFQTRILPLPMFLCNKEQRYFLAQRTRRM